MKKGFTLIELLAVVMIIGILAAIALPQYQVAIEKSRASEGLVIAKALANANERYLQANPSESGACLSRHVMDVDLKGGNWERQGLGRSGGEEQHNNPGINSMYPSCSYYQTNNFVYYLTNSHNIHVYRLHRGESITDALYDFTLNTDGEITCNNHNNRYGKSVCAMLGAS